MAGTAIGNKVASDKALKGIHIENYHDISHPSVFNEQQDI
jgi:hypothetical protein